MCVIGRCGPGDCHSSSQQERPVSPSRSMSWLAAGLCALTGSLAGLLPTQPPPGAQTSSPSAPRRQAGRRRTTAATRKALRRNMPKTRCSFRRERQVSAAGRQLSLSSPRNRRLEGGRSGLCHRPKDRRRRLGQRGLGVGHVQSDREGYRRWGRQVPVGFAQEGRKVAPYPRYVEFGCTACAACGSRFPGSRAGGEEVGLRLPRSIAAGLA